MDYNTLNISGRVSVNPSFKTSGEGIARCLFEVQCKMRREGKQYIQYIPIIAFNQRAEELKQLNIHKGMWLHLKCFVKSHYKKKYNRKFMDIVVDHIVATGKK